MACPSVIVVGCLLFVGRGVSFLFVVCCLLFFSLFVARCWLLVGGWWLSDCVVGCVLCDVCCVWFLV